MLVSAETSEREYEHRQVERDLGLVGNRVGRHQGEDRRQPGVRQRGADQRRPASARIRLSVSNCRTSRPRPAPSAARTRHLPLPSAGSRQQQIRDVRARDQQQQPRRRRAGPRRPGDAARERLREGQEPDAPLSGNWAGSRFFRSATIGRRSASACASVTPGFSRPSRWTMRTPSIRRPRSKAIGRYTSAPRHMNRFGMTPITVRLVSFSRSWRPSTFGSPPNWRCQKR